MRNAKKSYHNLSIYVIPISFMEILNNRVCNGDTFLSNPNMIRATNFCNFSVSPAKTFSRQMKRIFEKFEKNPYFKMCLQKYVAKSSFQM